MSEAASAAYSPKDVEQRWNEFWFSNKLFDLKIIPGAPAFSIALPPPNITGNLHMGHALNGTLQDVLIRWKRMQGYTVHWQPGTDHAGISTQMVVERKLKKEGKNRHAIGREKFLEHCWEWRHQYGNAIYNQYKRLGVSFSWDRLVFTMDPHYVKAIYRAFNILYKQGYIYRGKRVTNWCPRCQTSLSDLEVEHEETKGFLYHIKYLLPGQSTGLTVATTRPESMFGDVAVAVNPSDERYKDLVGKKVVLPLTDRQIPVIADDYVDAAFGTGALKITPAHDANDWEVGQRHKLEQPVVIDQHARLIANDLVPTQFQGLDRFDARKAVVEELQKCELLEAQQDYTTGLGHCERCHTAIEPYLSDQWYVRMKDLAAPAIEVVENGRVKFVPSRYASTYLDWMRNIRDWCISRQLWWGHRIPVWVCTSCGKEDAYEQAPDKCPACGGTSLEQDPDVLDTWFSSALWPFATIGWPDDTPEMQALYPTSILSTAREIINLWVARMIFTSLKFTGEVPFREVLIHPVVQTPDGKRMSKSKGNAVDPLDMIDKYGADANRFWFASVGIKGDQDVRFRDERLKEYQFFVNKIWNAGKFVLRNLEGQQVAAPKLEALTLADRWILSKYNRLIENLDKHLTEYDFDDASRGLYEFTWDYFCDWYLEIAKKQIDNETRSGAGETRNVLAFIFEGLMRALHPFMPFVTEEVWHKLPRRPEYADKLSIMQTEYPKASAEFSDSKAEGDMDLVMRVVRSVRNMRHTYSVPPRAEAELIIDCPEGADEKALSEGLEYVTWLANVSPLTMTSGKPAPDMAATEKVGEANIYLPLAKLIDVEKTRTKLVERKGILIKKIAEKKQPFERPDFQAKAPKEKVEAMRSEIADLEAQLASVDSQLLVLETHSKV